MFSKRYMTALWAVALLGLAACGDDVERILIPVPDESLEETLVDFTGGDITEPSAFDLITGIAVRTDLYVGWDFVLDVSTDDSVALWPRGALVGEDSDAGLQLVDRTFDGLTSAPDEGYARGTQTYIQEGDVLAVQSRRDPVYGTVRCRRYAKIEILAIDTGEGTVTFRHLINPNCEEHTLVPGAEG